jgi:methionyl-tRNA synthetase
VPEPGVPTEDDLALLALADALPATARAAMDRLALHMALAEIWAVVTASDRYFDGEKPWVLRKTDPARMGACLYVVAETLRAIGILVQPFMPSSAAKLLDLLAVPADRRRLADGGEGGRLVPGTALPPPSGLFPRFVEPEAGAG